MVVHLPSVCHALGLITKIKGAKYHLGAGAGKIAYALPAAASVGLVMLENFFEFSLGEWVHGW